ncbi:MAG: FHA domain-containing protein [Kiritimatiellia bacterium]
MNKVVHLVIERGTDAGRQLTLPPEGARLGRSSRNDIILLDPLLSRHHCRLYFKPDGRLWITDLGSSNQTLVNDLPVTDAPLKVGDRITVGNTVLRVETDHLTGAAQPPGAPAVDLGLSPPPAPPQRRHPKIFFLLVLALIMFALAVWAWWDKIHRRERTSAAEPVVVSSLTTPETLELRYEKVEADTNNIFRYYLEIGPDNSISLQIDDLQTGRHVAPRPLQVAPEYVRNLARTILDSGFLGLGPEYTGIQPGVLYSLDISVTIDKRTHRCRVINRVEPDPFKSVRELLEACGKNLFGIWALQYPPEKLVQMAETAYRQGKRLFDEREVRYGNLAAAIRSLNESEWYLETIEPKPAFYGHILATRSECERLLEEKYNEQNFRAERAIRVRDWPQAAKELRILLDMIPDPNDRRHTDARRRLLDVESHINVLRR